MRAAILLIVASCGSSSTTVDAVMPDERIIIEPDAKLAPIVSDDFSGASLDPHWMVLDATKLDVAVAGGQLTLTPHANALWYNASAGGLVYQLVTGDFTATATVHAHKVGSSAPPDQPIELGGVMARAANQPQENYVLIVIGFGEQGHLAVEHKTTTNSVSTFAESPYGADAELRLCRRGSVFTVYYRAPGAQTWTQDFQVTRTDLPATLQVGPNAYDGEANPDVAISFDEFTFGSASGGCTQ